MKRFVAVLLLSLCMVLTSFAKEPIRSIEGIVTKVSDGDTIQVTDKLGTKVKVRLYGIDAPETMKGSKKTGKVSKPGQPGGEEAFQALRQKVDHQRVRLDMMGIDRYRRAVAIVWLGPRNINLELVADGWAWAYKQHLDRPYSPEFLEVEDKARKAQMGIWRQGNPQPPWEFRTTLSKHN